LQEACFVEDCEVYFTPGNNMFAAHSFMLRAAYPALRNIPIDTLILPEATASDIRIILTTAYTGRF
jgi:hypothetical protein